MLSYHWCGRNALLPRVSVSRLLTPCRLFTEFGCQHGAYFFNFLHLYSHLGGHPLEGQVNF